jgi:hypothetical protein
MKTGIGRTGTKVWDDNGHFMVQYHATVVYDETVEGVTLNNGGWNTPTTARRMNQALVERGYHAGVHIRGGLMEYEGELFKDGRYFIPRPKGV